MVGKNARRAINKMVGRPYGLCEQGKLDCFRMIYDYLVELGASVPKEFEGQTLSTYGKLYLENPGLAEKSMVRFVESIAERIDKVKVFMGDILVMVNPKSGRRFLAIDAGNGNIVSSTEKFGVTILPMGHYKLEQVFRCQPK